MEMALRVLSLSLSLSVSLDLDPLNDLARSRLSAAPVYLSALS